MKSNGVDMLMSVSTPGRSHHGDPGLVEKEQIVSQQFEDLGRVRAGGTRALEIVLAAKLVRQRPSHSIDDKPTFDPEVGRRQRQLPGSSFLASCLCVSIGC
jgi:hypothetical protein